MIGVNIFKLFQVGEGSTQNKQTLSSRFLKHTLISVLTFTAQRGAPRGGSEVDGYPTTLCFQFTGWR